MACGLAQGAWAESPAGAWAFETDKVNLNCKLSGEMTIWQDKKAGLYACRFLAVQSCTGEPPIEIKVAQTCTATHSGNQVSITSKIDKTVSVKPRDMLETVEELYAPDHFMVSLNARGDEMTGMFHSLSQAYVRFRRREDLNS